MSKVQFMASLDQVTLDRLDALRVVMGVSRSEANRQALERGGLDKMERAQVGRIGRLHEVARANGEDNWRLFVRKLVAGRQPSEVPTLEVLEEKARGKLAALNTEQDTTEDQ